MKGNKVLNEICDREGLDRRTISLTCASEGYRIFTRGVKGGRRKTWSFQIGKKNTYEKYALIAFNSNVEPEYAWIIPKSEIKGRSIISVSETTLGKLDEWKYTIQDVY